MQDVHADIHTFRQGQKKGLIDVDKDPIKAVAGNVGDGIATPFFELVKYKRTAVVAGAAAPGRRCRWHDRFSVSLRRKTP